MQKSPEVLKNLDLQEEETVNEKDLGVNRNMMDYYAITMAVLICFFSMLVGASTFISERQNKTLNRLIIAPRRRYGIFLQKIFGLVPQVIIQFLISMLISAFIYKAHFATSFLANAYLFLMFIVVTLCMISIGAVIGLLIKSNPMIAVMPILWVMMFIGKTYSKEVNIKGLTDIMPNYLVQQSAFDLTIFGHYRMVNVVILTCSIVMVAALAIGAFLFSRKEEER
jgi:ABC-2 type transport system permease protein